MAGAYRARNEVFLPHPVRMNVQGIDNIITTTGGANTIDSMQIDEEQRDNKCGTMYVSGF